MAKVKQGQRYAGLAIIFAVGVGATGAWLLWESPAGDTHLEEPARPTPGDATLATAAEMSAQTPDATDVPQADASDCFAGLAATTTSRWLQKQRLETIDRFLWQHEALPRTLIEDLAGYVRRTARSPRAVLSYPVEYLAPSAAGRRLLSGNERQRVRNLLETGGIEALVALVDADVLQAHWGPGMSVVTYLIKEHGEALYAALPRMAGSLTVGLPELAAAIELEVAPENFRLLLEAADVDPAATWRDGANLAKLAALRIRPETLRLLTARGVDPATRPPTYGAILDEVVASAKQQNIASTDALADVVRQLAAAGAQPNLPSTLATLAEWLPEVPLPPLHPEAASLVDSLAGAAARVAAMDADWRRRIDAASRVEQRCEAQLDDFERSSSAFQATNLAAKQRYRDVRHRRSAEKRRAAYEAAARTAGELGEALYLATMGQQWRDALAIADQAGGSAHREVLATAFVYAAPLAVILEVAARSESLPDDLIRSVAHHPDAAAVAEALEPLGLDVHRVDEEGRNAFTALASSFGGVETQWQFAEYLANRSVAVKPHPFGLDPLDELLMRLVEWPERRGGVQFARFLIDHGAPVESSHIELAEQLSMADPGVYRRLMELVPELAS